MQTLNPEQVDFDRIADLLLEMGVYTSPSELHGLLCGLLAQGNAIDEQGWLASAATYLERSGFEEQQVKAMLLEVYATTLQQLSSSGFDITLVLPDIETDLSARAENLGRWCIGFLAGFGNVRGASMSGDLSESLNDLQEIGDIQSDDLADSDDSEHDLMQVEEYVRMVAILAFSEMNTVEGDKKVNTEGLTPLH